VERRTGTFWQTAFWQTAVVWLLFLASIGTLLFNSLFAFPMPGQEQSIRNQVREATLKLAQAAEPDASRIGQMPKPLPADADSRLVRLAHDVLVNYPGVEGGFFVNHERDEFAGYAFPTGPGGPHPPAPQAPPPPPKRRDPPPKEEPYIRLQARQSALEERGRVSLQSIDVGPSRVVIATAPVGTARPATLVVWMMDRVTGPETQHAQITRYQLSTFLALGGILAALGLNWNLERTLRRGRVDRERLRDELRRSEHLASLGLLLAKVAHEVRNPLAGIRSTAQLWERLPEQSRSPESLKAVIDAVDRLDGLVSQLLYFSRSDNAVRERVDMNAVIREACELLRAQAAVQNVRLDVDLAADLPAIRGSAPALRQVVLNLATNALQAMPQSGRLSCRTRLADNRRVELEIADTGPGIDPAVRERLFEPFFTTRPTGTGLGLALCREIVLQHDGTIELSAAVPHGTVCRIVFPTAD
jgi:two-component system, NtrC family, sensor histidine kinase HydH